MTPPARNRPRPAAVFVLLVLAGLLGACSRTPDEQAIRNAMGEMQEALEAGRPGDFMAHVGEDLAGADAGVDREALHNLLRGQVLANAKIGIVLGPVGVEVRGERATVRVTATFTGGSARWLPERGSIYTITSGWRRSDGEWKCINARWERGI